MTSVDEVASTDSSPGEVAPTGPSPDDVASTGSSPYEVASTGSSPATNGFSPSIDGALIADDGWGPTLPWCPWDGSLLACCFYSADYVAKGTWIPKTACFFYDPDETCDGPSDIGWRCCFPKTHDPNPAYQKIVDVDSCKGAGYGRRPKPPPRPPPKRPDDIPERIKKPKQHSVTDPMEKEPVNSNDACRLRNTPERL